MTLLKLAVVASLVTLSLSSFAIDKEWLDAVKKTGDRVEGETHAEWLDRINGNLDNPGVPQAPVPVAPAPKPRLIARLGYSQSYYAQTVPTVPALPAPVEKPERERTKAKLSH